MKKYIFALSLVFFFILSLNSFSIEIYNGYLKIDSYIGLVNDDGIERKLFAPYKIFNKNDELVRESGYHFDRPHTVELEEGEYKIVYFSFEFGKKELNCKVENHKTTICTLN
ncbi:MAG TPA: hypothetical protein PLG90_04035 [Ignavibacteria bacterium]|nr:hypothetical protein [Ignavibacteria bacterium]